MSLWFTFIFLQGTGCLSPGSSHCQAQTFSGTKELMAAPHPQVRDRSWEGRLASQLAVFTKGVVCGFRAPRPRLWGWWLAHPKRGLLDLYLAVMSQSAQKQSQGTLV